MRGAFFESIHISPKPLTIKTTPPTHTTTKHKRSFIYSKHSKGASTIISISYPSLAYAKYKYGSLWFLLELAALVASHLLTVSLYLDIISLVEVG